jgi:hypothetical protein
MRFPGFGRHQRQAVADPAAGQVYVERRPGESAEAFEARLAAAARERAALHTPGARRPVVVEKRVVDKRPVRVERRRHGFGLVGMMVVLVAAVGALWMVLAAREGSFAGAGAVVDRKIAEVSAPARVATNEAVDRTGAAVQNAGQTLESQGERIRQTAQ